MGPLDDSRVAVLGPKRDNASATTRVPMTSHNFDINASILETTLTMGLITLTVVQHSPSKHTHKNVHQTFCFTSNIVPFLVPQPFQNLSLIWPPNVGANRQYTDRLTNLTLMRPTMVIHKSLALVITVTQSMGPNLAKKSFLPRLKPSFCFNFISLVTIFCFYITLAFNPKSTYIIHILNSKISFSQLYRYNSDI